MKDNFRPPFSIDWKRPYDVGPSDEHLHAIGQFITIYSNVEWQIAEAFAFFIGKTVEHTQEFASELNLSMVGMLRYVRRRCEEAEQGDKQALQDLNVSLKSFDELSSVRHKIVHWQWGLDEGKKASVTDLIKPKSIGKTVHLSLEDIRNYCLKLMTILRAILLNMAILQGHYTRQQILESHTYTSPEKLFRAGHN